MGCAIELKFNRKGILSGQDSGMEPRRKKDTAWRRRFFCTPASVPAGYPVQR